MPSADPAGAGPTPALPGLDHPKPDFHPGDDELVHQGWVIALHRATFEGPDGQTFERDIVRHPGAVAVVAVTGQGSVVLVHQYRPAVDQWVLEIPAGTRDVTGEAPERTALRELAEEAGYAAVDLTLLTRCLVTPGFCDEVSSVYLATGLSPVPVDRQGVEEHAMEVVEVPLDRFDELVDQGVVVDATTILGVGLARRHLAAAVTPPL